MKDDGKITKAAICLQPRVASGPTRGEGNRETIAIIIFLKIIYFSKSTRLQLTFSSHSFILGAISFLAKSIAVLNICCCSSVSPEIGSTDEINRLIVEEHNFEF